MIKYTLSFFLLIIALCDLTAQDTYQIERNIPYISKDEKDTYRAERCKLDVYYPTNKKDFPTIVWFHGGGLTGGEKDIPEQLKNKGVAIVTVNYRLSPKATNPSYTIDAAEAVAWTLDNIHEYGGNPELIFVSGHSAGGYLALMLALDKSYLDRYGKDADKIKAYFPISGQTTTHYTIRQERGLPDGIPVIDEYAPSNKARKNTSPIFLYSGDRNLELTARYEENAHLAAVLKGLGNQNVFLYELEGFDHGTVVVPSCFLMLQEIDRIVKEKK